MRLSRDDDGMTAALTSAAKTAAPIAVAVRIPAPRR